MKIFWFILAGLVCTVLLMPTSGKADVKTFSWKAPTARTDGSPLRINEIQKYIIGCSKQTGQYDDLRAEAPGNVTTQQIANSFFGHGDFFCTMRTVDTADREGPWGNEVTFNIPIPPPRAPTDFQRIP
jgi:hypothetical protein